MFSQYQIKRARQTSLAAYLKSKRVQLKKEGKEYRVPGQGGLLVSDNKYWYASTGKGGNTLDYLIDIEGYDFKEAISKLTLMPIIVEPPPLISKSMLPDKVENEHNVIAYLNKTRHIPANLIYKCISKQLLYQDIKGNAVFICEPTGALIEGTLSQVRFKSRISAGVWVLPGNDIVAITESPVDALSLLAIKPGITVIATGGTFIPNTLMVTLNKLTPKLVLLAMDNDKAGREANFKLSERLTQYNTELIVPSRKDWNDDLIYGSL